MEIIDCHWEIQNLHKKTCEILLNESEDINIASLRRCEQKFQYIVLKVPVCKYEINKILTENQYVLAESQISLIKKIDSFSLTDKIVRYYTTKLKLQACDNEEKLNRVLRHVAVGMFDTDRIALNPIFGAEYANQRYKNWICTESQRDGSFLFEMEFNSMPVGFCLFRINNGTIDYLLGGLYPEFKGKALGIIVPLAPYVYSQMFSDKVLQNVKTKISSNNLEVAKCYMYCGYQIDDIHYVFSKNI